jgi:transcriptional antiterminator RfaH
MKNYIIEGQRSWYLLMTKPKQDSLAQENLQNQGYEVFRPTIQVQKKSRGKLLDVEESLFPRYLFIALCEETQDWGPIRSTRGVMQLVRFGSQAAKVPVKLVDELRNRVAQQQQPETTLKQGVKVRVDSGPLFGLEAIFKGYDADERVILLMNVLGKMQTLKLDEVQLEVLS